MFWCAHCWHTSDPPPDEPFAPPGFALRPGSCKTCYTKVAKSVLANFLDLIRGEGSSVQDHFGPSRRTLQVKVDFTPPHFLPLNSHHARVVD
jgi:hypothetical protein